MDLPEVFIFCWFPDEWLPRAVIIDISKLDDRSKEQMDKIISLGKVIEKILIKDLDEDGCGTISNIGIQNLDATRIIFSETDDDDDLQRILSTWQIYTDQLHIFLRMDNDNDKWYKYAHEYYINDANSNLSPIKLQEKLSQMTSFKDYNFKVKHCVLLSDVAIKQEKINQLRFFWSCKDKNRKVDNLTIIKLLEEKFNVENTMLSSADYGFLQPVTIQQWEELNESTHTFDDITILFQ